MAPMASRRGPYSEKFPERKAAELVAMDILKLDSEGGVWKYRNGEYKRIDYGPPGGHRMFDITLSPGEPGKVQVSRFVWQVHKGDIPPMMVMNHKDGDPTNNRLDNLEPTTHGGNIEHGYRVLGHESIHTIRRRNLDAFAAAARIAMEGGDLEPLRAALKVYDDYRPKTEHYAKRQERRRLGKLLAVAIETRDEKRLSGL